MKNGIFFRFIQQMKCIYIYVYMYSMKIVKIEFVIER